jgi:hypothetical protein
MSSCLRTSKCALLINYLTIAKIKDESIWKQLHLELARGLKGIYWLSNPFSKPKLKLLDIAGDANYKRIPFLFTIEFLFMLLAPTFLKLILAFDLLILISSSYKN